MKSTVEATPAPPRAGAQAPLSYEQEQLWLLDRILGSPALSAAPLAFEVTGRLDVAALRRAVGRMVARHEVLRTTLALTLDGPVQRVGEPDQVDFAVLERPGASPAQLRSEAREEARRGFDLELAPPLRTRVYRAEQACLVLIARHHLVYDGFSDALFRTELAALYRAESTGVPCDLPGAVPQYADYAQRQRAMLAGPRLAALLEYWTGVLAEPPPTLDLPGSGPRPAVRRTAGEFLAAPLPAELVAGLGALAGRLRVSPFMVLQAVLRVVLWRHAGASDVLVGVPMTARTGPDTQRMLGFLVNMLVVRAPVQPGASVSDLIAAERAALLGAYDHAEMPYALLTRTLGRQATDLRVTFSFDVEDSVPEVFPDLVTVEIDLGMRASQHDLEVKVVRSPAGVVVHWAYDDAIIDPGVAADLAHGYQAALAAAVADPGLAIAELPCGEIRSRAAARPGAAAAPDAGAADPHGGVDPGAAAAPDAGAAAADPAGSRPPTGPIEEILAELWGELLGVEPASVTDDIFALGGHSLTLARLGHSLEAEFGVRISVADLFENPALGRQAGLIEGQLRARLRNEGEDVARRLAHEFDTS